MTINSKISLMLCYRERIAPAQQNQFNYQKKVGANVELLTGKTGALLSYGIRIDKTQLALVTLANIEQATTEDW